MYLTWKLHTNFIVYNISFVGNRILALLCYSWFGLVFFFLNKNSHICNTIWWSKKQDEIEKKLWTTWRRGCTTCHQETSDSESLSIKTILFPKFILWLCLQWSTDLGQSIVNRSCASLNYLIALISNSRFAYALFTQNTKNASNTSIEPLHIRNFLLRIPVHEEDFSACLNIP